VKLLADTSALVALSHAADREHRRAVEFFERQSKARFVLSELILGELTTRLAAQVGGPAAARVARGVLASRRFEVLFTDAKLLAGALDLLERFADKRLSLTDAVSFALMDELDISAAFTFDRDFRDCGFRMVP
jgi:predicted nucleic acid-binding protein